MNCIINYSIIIDYKWFFFIINIQLFTIIIYLKKYGQSIKYFNCLILHCPIVNPSLKWFNVHCASNKIGFSILC